MLVETLAGRLRELVRVQHDGSVNAAAKAMRIPQPTLAQLVSGEVTNPRIDTVRRIARHFGASEAWLISGSGDAPAILAQKFPRVAAALLDWLALFDGLVLAPKDTAALGDVPRAMLRFAEDVGFAPHEAHDVGVEGPLRDYIRGLTGLWRYWIAAIGSERAASVLRTHRAALLLMTYVAPHAVLELTTRGTAEALTLESLEDAFQRYKQGEWENPSGNDPTSVVALMREAMANPKPVPNDVLDRRIGKQRESRRTRKAR